MPAEAPVAPSPVPVAPTSPAAGPALDNTVKIGLSNVPQTPAFQRASKAMERFTTSKPDEVKPPAAPDKPKPEDTTDDTDTTVESKTETAPADKADDKTGTQDAQTPPESGKKKERPNPWKMIDEWKQKYATLEREHSEYKSRESDRADSDPERSRLSEMVARFEKENTELKDRLRFADYENSEEYKDQFQKPYFDSYEAGRTWVSKLKVIDPQTGEQRSGKKEDYDLLVQAAYDDGEKANELLQAMFGDKALTVAPYLADTFKAGQRANNAIDEFKKTGAEKQKQVWESRQRQAQEMNSHLMKSWEDANKAALEHPQYGELFKQRENDPDWNQRLAKGFELAKRAFAENPFDPKLTPEQRKSIVERHAAVLNRAAAFGALRYENQKLKAQLAEREEALAAYEESEPGAGNGKTNGSAPQAANGGSALDRAMSALTSGNYRR